MMCNVKYNRVLCILCAVSIMLLTVFNACFTAFADNPFVPDIMDGDFDYNAVAGARPITIEEARDAAFQIYQAETGIDKDNLNGMLCFVADKEHYAVKVYAVDYPDEPFDVIMYIDDKQLYSFVYDKVVMLSVKVLTTVSINDGLDGGLKIMTKTMNFLTSNPLCSFILGLSFTFFAFRLIRSGIKSVKTM